jgi:hypothetical protein
MRKLLLLLLLWPTCCFAQLWSGILDSTRAADWQNYAGIPGGIPSATWTQCGSTIQASTYGNGSSDATSGIQTAINACGANQFVLLSPGTFRINSNLVLKSNMVLRGNAPGGANATIISCFGSNGQYSGCLQFGSGTGPNSGVTNSITSGATQGSTSMVFSGSGISTGQLLKVTGTNPAYVTEAGDGGNCNFCNNTSPTGGDMGQTVLVTNVSGSTVTFTPPLYFDYSGLSPLVMRYSVTAQNAGIENLQIFANNTGNFSSIETGGALRVWIYRVEGNFADHDHVDFYSSLQVEVRDCYFHDGFAHHSGTSDNELDLASNASSALIINSIFWRLHVGIMLEWGAAGNVIAYNYLDNGYNDNVNGNNPNYQVSGIDYHGAHPFFNLLEGNIVNQVTFDNYWGSSSHTTMFRNYIFGATLNVPPSNARGTLQTGSSFYEDQGNSFGLDNGELEVYNNIVGLIVGNAHTTSQSRPGVKISPDATGTYQTRACIRFGYENNNNGIGLHPPNTAYTTAFIHGMYDCNAGTFTWDSGHTDHTLPASFFLAAKPAWWGTVPWPAIGPDITGGGGIGGFTYNTPAVNCFNTTTSNGTSNTGTFDPATCYAAAPATLAAPMMSVQGTVTQISGSMSAQ